MPADPASAAPPVSGPGSEAAPGTSAGRSPVGVLLLQLGTPEAPTARALRPYLRQFLSDRRVIEVNPWLWAVILNLFILPFRPRASAAKYARIWSPEHGSPLLHTTRRQAELLQAALGPGYAVGLGMSYGRPTIAEVIDQMMGRGIDRFVALPMYPQYAASSTASALDGLYAAVLARRVVPAIHVVPPYYDDPLYIEALASRFREALAAEPRPPDHILLSFHGLPAEMVDKGDPYRVQVEATTRLLVERLGLGAGSYTQTFQSRFGRARWLEPYTDRTLEELARRGARRVLIHAPGFTADCLETLDELGNEYAHLFRQSGGDAVRLVPCLNEHPAWIAAMKAMVEREAGAWAHPRP